MTKKQRSPIRQVMTLAWTGKVKDLLLAIKVEAEHTKAVGKQELDTLVQRASCVAMARPSLPTAEIKEKEGAEGNA